MAVQHRSSDPENDREDLECILSSRVSHLGSGEYQIDVNGLSLSAGRFAIDLLDWSLPLGKRALAVILPNTENNARFEIGEIQVDESGATLVLFGPPEFDAQTLVF